MGPQRRSATERAGRKVDAGKLYLHIAERRPMAELADVHADAGAGRLTGKTVLLAR
ncbi:zinc-binding dehydrogenase [Nocardia salmonicida]|uniref:zinc-binding dehydrogenase n=1 Tax=Nocardia salmonicida TaxID=53431 RepID=UPI00364544AD